jgi:cell division protein FtsA
MQEQIVVGVDIGTTKVCAVVASTDDSGQVNILGVGVAPSEGLTRGVVTNIDRTVTAVKKAIVEAAHMAGVIVESVIVGIAGDHIQSFQSRSVVTISNKNREITAGDVQRLLDDSTRLAIPNDRRILHVVPQEFIVDGQDGVVDPVGMSGVRLEANVHIITGAVSSAANIFRCIQKAGYEVADIMLEPLASSYAVLYPEEKEVGAILIDIGGGTTDIAVFEDHKIRHTAVIAVAGSNVTEDIRQGLSVTRDQAEQLKRQFGCALVSMADDDEILIQGINDQPDKTVSEKALAHIIQPRLVELLNIVGIEVRRVMKDRRLGCVVLTGGGSQTKGTADLAREVLGIDSVRIGRPIGLSGGMVSEVQDPKYATAVGLTLHGLRPEVISGNIIVNSEGIKQQPHAPSQGANSSFTGIFGRMKGWFEEF